MMTNANTSTPRDPEVGAEVDKVTSLIAGARQLIGEGKSVDLAALETRVTKLCEDISGMQNEDARRLKDPLATILSGLDGLEADLKSQHTTATRVSEDGMRHRATSAYRSPTDQS
jgi:hypothetical protein